MARPSRPWFRFYVEALHDPKLRRMPPAHRWVWVAVLAAARASCVPGDVLVSEKQPMTSHDLADFASVPVREVNKALAAFEAAGMVTREDAGHWRVTHWHDRQYESDDVTERTRKHRSRERSHERDRNVPTPFPGTPPETETDTDTPPTPTGSLLGAVDNSGEAGFIDQALQLAASRYGNSQVRDGKGSNADGLARWWTQEHAVGARARATNLLAEYDLKLTQLADALLAPNPQWLRHHRRREVAS